LRQRRKEKEKERGNQNQLRGLVLIKDQNHQQKYLKSTLTNPKAVHVGGTSQIQMDVLVVRKVQISSSVGSPWKSTATERRRRESLSLVALGCATTSIHSPQRAILVSLTIKTKTVPGVRRQGSSASRIRSQDQMPSKAAGALMVRIGTIARVNKETASIFLPVM